MDLVEGGRLNPTEQRSGHVHTADSLADVDTTGALEGDALLFNGVAWGPGAAVPPGTIVASGRLATNAPVGWIRCSGGRVSRTQFAELFEAIGTTYGAGDGSTTFNVPAITGNINGTTCTWWIKF